mmetsp:Transcript_50090/g.160361  ORF Transcript_50090/g.160361 Transcript_50090/m.160361 type:complete len:297 (+) Transcript_50090:1151-2041(+)
MPSTANTNSAIVSSRITLATRLSREASTLTAVRSACRYRAILSTRSTRMVRTTRVMRRFLRAVTPLMLSWRTLSSRLPMFTTRSKTSKPERWKVVLYAISFANDSAQKMTSITSPASFSLSARSLDISAWRIERITVLHRVAPMVTQLKAELSTKTLNASARAAPPLRRARPPSTAAGWDPMYSYAQSMTCSHFSVNQWRSEYTLLRREVDPAASFAMCSCSCRALFPFCLRSLCVTLVENDSLITARRRLIIRLVPHSTSDTKKSVAHHVVASTMRYMLSAHPSPVMTTNTVTTL